MLLSYRGQTEGWQTSNRAAGFPDRRSQLSILINSISIKTNKSREVFSRVREFNYVLLILVEGVKRAAGDERCLQWPVTPESDQIN